MKRYLEFVDLVLLSTVLRGAIKMYQVGLGWMFGGACRFYPSCSRYADESIRRHGAARGVWLAVRRLARCHPFHPGGVDPVP